MQIKLRSSPYGYWSTTNAFVVATAAAVIGLTNVWRLPYLIGEYGGSAFLTVYILALLLVSLPLLMAEIVIGRLGRRNVVGSMRLIAAEGGVNSLWTNIGRLALLGAVLVLSYYSVIAGWSMGYIFRAAGGAFLGGDVVQSQQIFLDFVGDPEKVLSWHTVFMVMITVLSAHGVKRGLEPATKYFLTGALSVLILILGAALWFGDSAAAVTYLLRPDFSALGWRGALEALHQAFFSLGLGAGVMVAFGVYMPQRTPLLRAGLGVAGLDLLFGLIAGIIVFAFLLAADADPEQGVRLAFQAVPAAFGETAVARLVAVGFYTVLLLLALTSAMALMEPVVVWIMERFNIDRVFAATSAGLVIWFFGLGTLLSFNALSDFTLFGQTYYGWLSFLTSHILLPLTGLLICVFVSRVLPDPVVRQAWGDEGETEYVIWRWCLRYPARIGLIVVLFYAVGLLDLGVEFFSASTVTP